MKLAATLLAVILVFGSVWGVNRAAADSLPGEPLYNLKLAVEEVRLRLTTSHQARADLALALAEERLDEIAALAESERAIDDTSIGRARECVSYALQAATQAEEHEGLGALERFMVAMQTRLQAMERIANQLPEPEQAQVRDLLREMGRVRLEVGTGQDEPEGEQVHQRLGTPPIPTNAPGSEPEPQATQTPAGPDAIEPGGSGPGPQATQTPRGLNPTEQPSSTPASQATQTPGGPNPTKQPSSTPASQATATPRAQSPGEPGGPQATTQPDPGSGPQATPAPGGSDPTDQSGSGSDDSQGSGGNGGQPDSAGDGDGHGRP